MDVRISGNASDESRGKVSSRCGERQDEWRRISIMDRWECTVCGYIYDPEEGDPVGDIDPGTPFEDLPDDWVCPQCGATKDLFEKLA